MVSTSGMEGLVRISNIFSPKTSPDFIPSGTIGCPDSVSICAASQAYLPRFVDDPTITVFLLMSAAVSFHHADKCLRTSFPVHRRGDDTSRIARAFSAREQSLRLRMHQRFWVSWYAHRCRSSALHSHDLRFTREVSLHLDAERLEGFAE